MREPLEVELAYLAGIIDADGYVSIQRSVKPQGVYFAALVGITGCRRQPHDLAAEVFGGNVIPAGTRERRFGWYWQRAGRRAVPALTGVRPYLRIKARQAALALELQEAIALYGASEVAHGVPAMDALRDELRSLQVRGAANLPVLAAR